MTLNTIIFKLGVALNISKQGLTFFASLKRRKNKM